MIEFLFDKGVPIASVEDAFVLATTKLPFRCLRDLLHKNATKLSRLCLDRERIWRIFSDLLHWTDKGPESQQLNPLGYDCWMDALWLLQQNLETVPEVEVETIVLLNEVCKHVHNTIMTILDQHLFFPMERFREFFSNAVPHLMRIRHFTPAAQHFLAMLHQVLDRVDHVDLEPFLAQAMGTVADLVELKRNCPVDETIFHELLRATFPSITPEPLPLEDVQMQVAESFEFQIAPDAVTIPLGPLLNNRSVVITMGGLCFELFRTGNPDSKSVLTMRWIHPGQERSISQKTGGRIEGCTNEAVSLASRDITRPAPVDRKGKLECADRNRLVSAARVAVDLKAFFYLHNGARSRTTEEVAFPEHDLILLPYSYIDHVF